MENINSLLEVPIKPKQRKTSPIDSNTKTILKIVRDTFAFFFIYLASYMVLFAADGMSRSEREKVAILVLIILVFTYTLLTNLTFKLVSLLYSAVVFVLILYIIDYRQLTTSHALVLFGIIGTAALFHFFKRHQSETNIKNKVPTVINLSDFDLIGTLEQNLVEEAFIKKRELSINKRAYKNYKPVLVHKNTSDPSQMVLKYTNKDDLHFTLIITELGCVYIDHWKRNEQTPMINKFIFEAVQEMS